VKLRDVAVTKFLMGKNIRREVRRVMGVCKQCRKCSYRQGMETQAVSFDRIREKRPTNINAKK
jgi:hypothetical protein